ncbi:MAG: DUF3086 domain-containing protein [Gomphosphaeria aponina SAG 52.96 = DSM 107014]|uniref:DUF3086 domain-containing protein n=1 Tax=Gomphosphaeria aponina SAG 52.96 = DSM 107014 TaxID=1521640 RepID=A0A941GV17_9CHRO|nr:DUF3086 domain-containing protein [Gomphosphaeria aponina SAG 52.96 = DSM 107014]
MSDNPQTPEANLPSKSLEDAGQKVPEAVSEKLANKTEKLLTPAEDLQPEKPEKVVISENNKITSPVSILEGEKLDETQVKELEARVAELQQQKETLEAEIMGLAAKKNQLLSEQLTQMQASLQGMVQEGVKELEERKSALQIEMEKLERRRERIQEEMRNNFAGVSQELAIRVQGFRDYLVGSLQDLAAAAEQLELPSFQAWEKSQKQPQLVRDEYQQTPQFAEREFKEEVKEIRKVLDQYRLRPDYYGPAWQLRRTFEPIHAERVSSWFFSSGGRGAIKTMGSRLQNILVTSAVISVLHKLYGSRCRSLVLANSPERLGEWRRGLQDCLGISRSDFGPERGIVLFEAAEALVQKADRLVEEKQLPLVIIDETEGQISLGLLQFPLWLAFAPEPAQMSSYMY